VLIPAEAHATPGHPAYAGHPAEAQVPPQMDLVGQTTGVGGKRRLEQRPAAEDCVDRDASCKLVLASSRVDCDTDLGAMGGAYPVGTLARHVCAASCGACGGGNKDATGGAAS